jgi:hypothetical protein
MGMLTQRMREWLLQLSCPFKGDPSSSGIKKFIVVYAMNKPQKCHYLRLHVSLSSISACFSSRE